MPPVEVVAPESTRGIYEAALAELQTDDLQEAKRVIKQRILEVQRLKKCLAKAEANLQRLLEKNPSEIALLD